MSYTSQYPPAFSSAYVIATTRRSGGSGYWPYFTTNPALSLTGAYATTQWLSAFESITNQRFHIDLGSAKIITRVYYENSHNFGLLTNSGVRNFTLWGSNSAADFADLIYSNDGTWAQLVTDVSQLAIHVTSDTADPRYVQVTNEIAYRYYAFKFADNRGNASYMGVRRIELQTTDPSIGRPFFPGTPRGIMRGVFNGLLA